MTEKEYHKLIVIFGEKLEIATVDFFRSNFSGKQEKSTVIGLISSAYVSSMITLLNFVVKDDEEGKIMVKEIAKNIEETFSKMNFVNSIKKIYGEE